MVCVRVLVVDDEARLAAALQRGLQAEGFAVDVAGDGQDGLELARLRALLRRGTPERPAVLTVGDLQLDPALRRVTAAGTEVTLTAREFALLEYLMRHPGEVVSKTELLDHVWDAAMETAPNAVEVYVGYLRRKIGRDRLETVRGAGYRLATVGR